MTQKEIKAFIQSRLRSNRLWALRALVVLFERQTADEQVSETTKHKNNVGFSGVDAEILSSFAKFYKRTGFLTPKQFVILFRIIPRYWKQVLSVCDQNKLETQMKGVTE